MHRSGVRVLVKGVFCHVSGRTGPVVDFDKPSPGRGCEICDLLVLVTYGVGTKMSLGNAVFLQAKLTRDDLKGGSSTDRQRELYEKAPEFRFRYSDKYTTALGEPKVPGTRQMPPKDYGGFCYWPFTTHSGSTKFPVNSSTVIVPNSVQHPRDDVAFGEALLGLMIGKFGEQMRPAKKNEFGWNRIVHDVVFRSMHEALRCSGGIKDVKTLPRISPDGRAELLAAMNMALVLNPLRELSESFQSEDISTAANDLSARRRIDAKQFESIFRKLEGEPPPPIEPPEVGDNEGGGGAFIHIHIATEEEA